MGWDKGSARFCIVIISNRVRAYFRNPSKGLIISKRRSVVAVCRLLFVLCKILKKREKSGS